MIDNHTVHIIIKDKLTFGGGSSIRDRLSNALNLIMYDRENNHPGDPDYAAAEHYLYSRWLISWTGAFGYPFLALGAGGYSLVKRLLPAAALQAMKTGKGPVTPYDPEQVAWAKRGADDGMIDFNAVIAGHTVPHDPPDPM